MRRAQTQGGAHMAQTFTLHVNGQAHQVEAEPDMPLLYALRDNLRLNNPKFGCGLAQCGACTVQVNGSPIRSCITPVEMVDGQQITTLNGLGTPEKMHPLQKAYVEEQAAQCGYCVNGWIMTAAALLKQNPDPSDADIRQGLAGLKCRCGAHVAIMRAIKRAAEEMRA
jgi:aerobic-type carbon monoxide dehydrogenase small subunit (CoxS/CutS family)